MIATLTKLITYNEKYIYDRFGYYTYCGVALQHAFNTYFKHAPVWFYTLEI